MYHLSKIVLLLCTDLMLFQVIWTVEEKTHQLKQKTRILLYRATGDTEETQNQAWCSVDVTILCHQGKSLKIDTLIKAQEQSVLVSRAGFAGGHLDCTRNSRWSSNVKISAWTGGWSEDRQPREKSLQSLLWWWRPDMYWVALAI